MKLTHAERKEAMTEFAKDPGLDVYTLVREDGTIIFVSRTNQIVQWRSQ